MKQKVNTQNHITERKRADEALQAERNKLQSVVDAMEYGLTIQDRDYNIIYQNEPQRATFGDHMGEKCYRVYEGNEKVCDGCPVEKAFRDGKSHTSERRSVLPSGEVTFWENTANPIRDARGNIVSCLEITRNITEHKQAEELYRTLASSSPVGVYIVQGGKFVFVNPQFQKYTGFSEDELVGTESLERVHPEDREQVRESAVEMLKGNRLSPYELRYIVKNGETLWATETVTPIRYKGKRATLGNFMDISESKRAEEELHRAKEQFQALVDKSPLGVSMLTKDGHYQYLNPKFVEMFGYTLEDLPTGREWFAKAYPDPEYRSKIIANWHADVKLLKRGEVEAQTYTVTCKDGSEKITQFRSVALETGNYFVLYEDITERRKAEEELKLRAQILDSATDAIHVHDEKNIIYVNEAACRAHGYSKEELMKMKIPQIVDPGRARSLNSDRQELLKKGHIVVESAHLRKDGSTFPVEVHARTIESGGRKLFLTVARDITARKRAEEALRQSREQLRKMFESMTDGILVIDLNGVITEVNQRMIEMHGYKSKGELFGKSASKLVAPRDHERITTNMQQAVKRGKIKSMEYTLLKADGTEFPGELSTSALRDASGKPVGHITIARDITERKRMEQQLKRQMEELQVAYQKLKELDQLKDSFLSTVSHELRTPLTSIKSFSEILLSYDEDKETQKEFLTIINEESNRLTRLINDFLDLSKIEAGRMQWETVELSLSEVIQTALNATQALTIETKLKVDTELSPDLPTVQCDKDRLVQVVTNLLSNAIKFTPEGGAIQLKAQVQNGSKSGENSNMTMVSVSDSGIGIAQKDYKGIFEKFKQVGDTLSNKPKGTGLGLPICKEIIEHYGGRIWVESEPGKGSTFFFTLPITQKRGAKAPKAPEVKKEEVKVAVKGGKKILVVDDEANIRRFLKHELTNRGYQVLEASGGKEAIDLAREHHPDLITLDVVMPDISGHDVTAVLKNDAATKDIPILVLSIVEEKEKAYKLGANDFVTKPFTMKSLTEKINRLLQDAEIRDAHKTILVVDDDKSLVRSIKYRLEKKGFSVDTAYGGKEALEMAEGHHPNLVLLDIVMPEMDGYEVMKALKHKPNTAGIPIVVMTGVENVGGKVKALSVGATEYLNKSSGFDQLLKAIEGILYNKSGG